MRAGVQRRRVKRIDSVGVRRRKEEVQTRLFVDRNRALGRDNPERNAVAPIPVTPAAFSQASGTCSEWHQDGVAEAPIGAFMSFGRRSAIHTMRLTLSWVGKTLNRCIVMGQAASDRRQTSRCALSSRSTISSRTSMPFPNVTKRAPGLWPVLTTNPGTSRVCRAPTSHRGPNVLGSWCRQNLISN
jgi:hypothetical protein